MRTKKKVVRAYAVVDSNGEIQQGQMFGFDEDCPCRAQTFLAATIFKEKSSATLYKNHYHQIVPCLITLLPKKVLKAKQ